MFLIYYLSLFYLDFICFYFLFRTILLQLQVILFQEQLIERLSLGAKERRFGSDLGQKYEDLVQKYEANKSEGLGGHKLPFVAFASSTSCLFSLFLT